MHIRHYRPGDEQAQMTIFNTGAGGLPRFKPATAEEIARRYRTGDPDPKSKFYAIEGDRIVGYAVYSANGRISYPWCLQEQEAARVPLLDAVLAALRERGVTRAWAAYRGDWQPVLAFFAEQGFTKTREMINYVAEVSRLPRRVAATGQTLGHFARSDAAELLALNRGLFGAGDPDLLTQFFLENPYFRPASLFTLKTPDTGRLEGFGVTVIDPQYAEPTKLDAAMPCFRLGALGTEGERHKRVNGMFSCVFTSEAAGERLLAEAAERLTAAGLTHVAAQAPSDQAELCAFYDRYFARQGAFPIMSREL